MDPLFQVLDKRETYITVDAVRARIFEFVTETSRQIEGIAAADVLNEKEINVALDTVLPRPGLLHWMNLPEVDKITQLQELKDIIPGIRTFNNPYSVAREMLFFDLSLKIRSPSINGISLTYSRSVAFNEICLLISFMRWVLHRTLLYIGKGGSQFSLPIERYEAELLLLWTRVTEELNAAHERSAEYEDAIRLNLPKLGMRHVFMQRLRDELNYHLQAATCLEALQCLLDRVSESVQQLSFSCSQKLDTLQEAIGSRKCIPNEIVYPLFRAVGSLQRSISDEYRALQAYSRAAVSLLSLSREPAFQRTPTGISRLSSNYGLAKLRIVINNCEFLPAEIYSTNLLHMEKYALAIVQALFHFHFPLTFYRRLIARNLFILLCKKKLKTFITDTINK
eukprot:Gb_05840 [translate_table: standard]